MRVKFYFLIACCLQIGSNSLAQTVQQKVNQYRKENESKIIDEYVKFVSIPNVTRDTSNILRNAAFIKMMMEIFMGWRALAEHTMAELFS